MIPEVEVERIRRSLSTEGPRLQITRICEEISKEVTKFLEKKVGQFRFIFIRSSISALSGKQINYLKKSISLKL